MRDRDALTRCLNTIEQKLKTEVVIVPGGGVFADQVRKVQQQWQFDDEVAHQMALLAMQQTALLFKSIKPRFLMVKNISAMDNYSPIAIWLPDIQELNLSAVKANWDITSDTLAAWVANQLTTDELILVKSARVPINNTIQQMQQQGLVDKAFCQYIKNAPYKTTLLNKNNFNEYAFT